MRMGHCIVKSHLHTTGLHSNVLCNECNTPETVKHLLIPWGEYAEARHKLRESIQDTNTNFDWLTVLKNPKEIPYVLKSEPYHPSSIPPSWEALHCHRGPKFSPVATGTFISLAHKKRNSNPKIEIWKSRNHWSFCQSLKFLSKVFCSVL